jgi:hypothetical protein
MAGDNEPNQNMDDDLDIVNEDTNQGLLCLQFLHYIKTFFLTFNQC